MKTVAFLLAVNLVNTVANAQVPLPPTPLVGPELPASIEGPISAVEINPDGSATITVMGMEILVPPTATVTTPTATLSLSQLGDPSPLPGRTEAGFIGGTAIILGTANAAGLVTADEVFTEPAENILIGVVTSNSPDPLTVNHVPVQFLTDGRMPAKPPFNELGLEVDPARIPVGGAAAVAGYFDGSSFQAFEFEATGAPSAIQTPVVVISGVQGRVRGGRLEVRGGLSGISGAQTLELRDGETGAVLGTAVFQEAPVNGLTVLVPGTSDYLFRVRGLKTLPASVKIVNLTSPSEATATVVAR